ncbi:MAG TPA: cation diffusion facilitator family transporter, partial [Magnetococcales bacterium]|nr:cation diffusion facilitator family transporter [Magnetococcales bacterium]
MSLFVEVTLNQSRKNDRDPKDNESLRMSNRAIIVGLVINVVLSVVKIVVGIVATSPALVADGVHSISDLFSDGAIWVANHMSRAVADEGHPYGHGRYETLAILFSGILLFALA